jgi:hypothetical protein
MEGICMSRDHNPVWNVYDLYRTARLNAKYYSALLHQAENRNFWLEFILLCTAPTSAVAGLWFWDTELGKNVWQYLGVVAALAAVLKPLLSLPKKMKGYESLVSGYKMLEHDLHEIQISITEKKKYDKTAQTDFKKALKRKGVLVGKETDAKENKKLKQRCEKEIISELPSSSFYIPKEENNDKTSKTKSNATTTTDPATSTTTTESTSAA